MLVADSRALAADISAAGGDCELQVWPDQVHVFQALPRLTPEAVPAMRKVASFRGRIHAGCELFGRVQQLDPLAGVYRTEVRGSCQSENRSRDLVGTGRTLRDGGVAPAIRADLRAPGSNAWPRPSSKSVNRVSGPSRLPTAASIVWVGLEANGGASEPPLCLSEGQPRADDLRCLCARSRQHFGQCHDPALRSGDAGVKTHHGAHRHGSRTRAHANPSADTCRPQLKRDRRRGTTWCAA